MPEIHSKHLLTIIVFNVLGCICAQTSSSTDLYHCRQNCYQECWNSCDRRLGPFLLTINSALRHGSIVAVEIAWDQAITNSSKQCLVTWEISGGGLIGNLLTDGSAVELSLWPETTYYVHVTCKHKDTGDMRRSSKLYVDTKKVRKDFFSNLRNPQGDRKDPSNHQHLLHNHDATVRTFTVLPDPRIRTIKKGSNSFLASYDAGLSEQTNSIQSSADGVEKTKLHVSISAIESAVLKNHPLLIASIAALLLFFILASVVLCLGPSSKTVAFAPSIIDSFVQIDKANVPSRQMEIAAASTPTYDRRSPMDV